MIHIYQIKKDIDSINRNKTGSFSIEISLIFPIVMIIIFCFVWQMTLIRCEMLFKCIIIKESEKVSFLGVLSEYSTDIYKKITGKDANDDTTEFILKEIYELSLKKQIKDHYQLLCAKNKYFRSLIINHTEFIECGLYEDDVIMTSLYTIYTPFKTIDRQFSIPLRLWSHGDNSGKLDQQEGTSVWQYDNFERGRILRRRFGGNLPFGFPVLSGFSNGNALIIKSMDLTAPTWTQPEEVKKEMYEAIDELVSYDGMPVAWGEKKIIINNSEIINRFIKFIIPENTAMDKYLQIFNETNNYSSMRNIEIEIIPYQNSVRNSTKE